MDGRYGANELSAVCSNSESRPRISSCRVGRGVFCDSKSADPFEWLEWAEPTDRTDVADGDAGRKEPVCARRQRFRGDVVPLLPADLGGGVGNV
jgi:hypothetical protein